MSPSDHKSPADCNRHPSQRSRLLEFLQSRNGAWVPLPEILDLHIAQYSARILELRRAGYQIENKQVGDHSWFRLLGFSAPAPERTGRFGHHGQNPTPNLEPGSVQGELFNLTQQHRDLG